MQAGSLHLMMVVTYADICVSLEFIVPEGCVFHSSTFRYESILTASQSLLLSRKGCGHGFPHCAVHRRPSTSVETPQGGPGISSFFRRDRVERIRRDEDVGGNVGGCG